MVILLARVSNPHSPLYWISMQCTHLLNSLHHARHPLHSAALNSILLQEVWPDGWTVRLKETGNNSCWLRGRVRYSIYNYQVRVDYRQLLSKSRCQSATHPSAFVSSIVMLLRARYIYTLAHHSRDAWWGSPLRTIGGFPAFANYANWRGSRAITYPSSASAKCLVRKELHWSKKFLWLLRLLCWRLYYTLSFCLFPPVDGERWDLCLTSNMTSKNVFI